MEKSIQISAMIKYLKVLNIFAYQQFCLILFLEFFSSVFRKCKYIIKEKMVHKYIVDDVEVSSDYTEKIQLEKNSDYEENSDKESSSEER